MVTGGDSQCVYDEFEGVSGSVASVAHGGHDESHQAPELESNHADSNGIDSTTLYFTIVHILVYDLYSYKSINS